MALFDISFFLLIAWISIAVGRVIALAIGLPTATATIEKNLIGYSVGLVVFAYGMLTIGLAGVLYPSVAIGLIAVLALAGISQWKPMLREVGTVLTTCFHPPKLVWLMIATLAFFSGVSLIGCFAPAVYGISVLNSILTESDSISYHLADPKLYILAHKIYPLYWESHSNFAFTGEMWYTFGLLFKSVPLAKLFHWSCGLAAALAVYRLALRFTGLRTAVLATILFASAPIVFWEAGTAYVDLVATYFSTVTLFALAVAIAQNDEKWFRLSAVLMGLTLASKATALVTLALFTVAILYWRLRVRKQSARRAIGQVAAWCAIALAVGSPWYIKSTVYTGNPVYPFYYKIFGGKYWNASNAATYDASNAGFGLGHQPINLVLAPWNLIMYTMPGHPAPFYTNLPKGNIGKYPFNNFPSELVTFSPVLLAALFVPLLFWTKKTPPSTAPTPPLLGAGGESDASRFVIGLSVYGGVSFVLWFFQMQYIRYLLPMLPVYCVLAAYVVDRSLANRSITGKTLAVLTTASVAFSAYVGCAVVGAQLPVATGQQTTDDYIQHGFSAYAAMQYINHELPPETKLVFYGFPTGFYCDRPYLWGEREHSAVIPYETMHSASDLLAYYRKTHVTHVLINRREFIPAPGPGLDGWIYDLTFGSSSPVFDEHGVAVFALPESVSGGASHG